MAAEGDPAYRLLKKTKRTRISDGVGSVDLIKSPPLEKKKKEITQKFVFRTRRRVLRVNFYDCKCAY